VAPFRSKCHSAHEFPADADSEDVVREGDFPIVGNQSIGNDKFFLGILVMEVLGANEQIIGHRAFEAAAELGLEGIVSKRAASRYRSGPSRSWLKIKNMVESEFVLLGTDRDASGIPWALLASDRDGELKFAGPAILHPLLKERAHWATLTAALVMAKPPLKGLRQGSAQWLRPELRVRVRHLKAKGMLRHATVKQLITD
jgi:ATP-dependent DNA ligase